jgi:hypothetical protein
VARVVVPRTHPSSGQALSGAGQVCGGAGQVLNGLGGMVKGTGRMLGAGLHALGDCTEKVCEAGGGMFHGGHHAMQKVAKGLDSQGQHLAQPVPPPPPPPLFEQPLRPTPQAGP